MPNMKRLPTCATRCAASWILVPRPHSKRNHRPAASSAASDTRLSLRTRNDREETLRAAADRSTFGDGTCRSAHYFRSCYPSCRSSKPTTPNACTDCNSGCYSRTVERHQPHRDPRDGASPHHHPQNVGRGKVSRLKPGAEANKCPPACQPHGSRGARSAIPDRLTFCSLHRY